MTWSACRPWWGWPPLVGWPPSAASRKGLANVVRHAGRVSTTVRVEVEDCCLVTVTDAGGPAQTHEAGGTSGNGLTGMSERVSALGGEVTSGPQGPGWRDTGSLAAADVVHVVRGARHVQVVARTGGAEPIPGWQTQPIGLEDLVLAYLQRAHAHVAPAVSGVEVSA